MEEWNKSHPWEIYSIYSPDKYLGFQDCRLGICLDVLTLRVDVILIYIILLHCFLWCIGCVCRTVFKHLSGSMHNFNTCVYFVAFLNVTLNKYLSMKLIFRLWFIWFIIAEKIHHEDHWWDQGILSAVPMRAHPPKSSVSYFSKVRVNLPLHVHVWIVRTNNKKTGSTLCVIIAIFIKWSMIWFNFSGPYSNCLSEPSIVPFDACPIESACRQALTLFEVPTKFCYFIVLLRLWFSFPQVMAYNWNICEVINFFDQNSACRE